MTSMTSTGNRSLAVTLSATLLFCHALAACGGGGGSSHPGVVTPPEPGTVYGIVTDIGSGAGIAGAVVTGGGQSATTDAHGTFSLAGLAAGNLNLSISMQDYAPGFASALVGDTTQTVLARLKKQGTPQLYDATSAMTLSEKTEAGPYAVILAPNSLDTSDTNLTVSITPLDPTKERDALPGILVAGGTTSSLLIPVTFAEFSILDSAGKRVNLLASASAQVELPIPPPLRSAYPLDTKIHCYAYDAVTGQWEDFVEGTVRVSTVDGTSPVLAATVRHFSWYGGAPEGNNCVDVYVKVVSAVAGAAGVPLTNARVEVSPGTAAYTDASGVALVRTAIGTTPSTYVAYQTGLDVDGALTGTKGARYVEFGKVEEDLPGLTQKPCTGDPGATPGQANVRGSQGTPLVLQIGRLTGVLYQATAILSAGANGSGGDVEVILEQGVPGPDGMIVDPMPASGAKITFGQLGGTAVPALLAEIAAGTGLYTVPAGATVIAGGLYLLSIDADGNGSIDGTGTAFALGQVAWTSPSNGAAVSSSGFTASWSDSGSALGGPGYAPVYEAVFSGSDATADTAFYLGTDRQFAVKSAVMPDAPGLQPGAYTGSIIGFSGALAGGGGTGVTSGNNISGVGVTGLFYSVSGSSASGQDMVMFTVQ